MFWDVRKMKSLSVTAYGIAHRFKDTKEVKGSIDNHQIMAMLKLDNKWPQNDETPWCSAFVNYIAFILNLQRSKDLRARSWMKIGTKINLEDAFRGFDIVVLKRGKGKQPGPEVINAPGHVGFYHSHDDHNIYLLGGNQKDSVNISAYNIDRILAIRSLI